MCRNSAAVSEALPHPRILAAFFAAGGENYTYNFIWNRKKQPVLTGLLFFITNAGECASNAFPALPGNPARGRKLS